MRKQVWAVLAAAGIWLGGTQRLQAVEAPVVGDEAGSFTLKAINTEALGNASPNVRLDDYVGPEAKAPKKGLLLSFFASYCEPCKREMPFLQVLSDSYAAQGLQVLSVTIDKEADKIELAHALATQNNVKFPLLSDHYGILARRYSVTKLPCVYLINSAGKFAWTSVGYGDDASKQMHDEVRKALGIPASEPTPAAVAAYLFNHQGGARTEAVDVPGAEDPNRAVQPPGSALNANPNLNRDRDRDDARADAADKKGKGRGRKRAHKALADD